MQTHAYALAPMPASLEELIQKAKIFVGAAKAPATLKAYRNDWRDFDSWCRAHQLPSLASTPETVALYIADRRLHIGVGHHHTSPYLDLQGAPGRGIQRLSGHNPSLRGRRDSQRNPPYDRHTAARRGPASRTGVVLRRFSLAASLRFLWECLSSQTENPFRAGATSYPVCGFPALGSDSLRSLNDSSLRVAHARSDFQ